MRLEGKVALVSGSTRGIGRSIAQMFAREGAKVAVTGRTVDRGQKVVDLITADGGEAAFFALDVTEEASVASVIDQVVERFGSLTTLVNNAAPTVEVGSNIKPLVDVTTEEWELILRSSAHRQRVLELQVRDPAPGRPPAADRSSTSPPASRSSGWAASPRTRPAKGGMNSLTRTIAVESGARTTSGATRSSSVASWPTGDAGAGITPGASRASAYPTTSATAAT